MTEYKLDIRAALTAMDRRNGDWLSKQSDEARKGFHAPVFLRWASAIADDGIVAECTISLINERVNIDANEIMTKHPDLLFRLAASCGSGHRQDHQWIPMVPRSRRDNKARALIAKHFAEANDEEIDLLLSLHTRDSFKEFAMTAGLSNEDAREAIKAYAGYAKESTQKTEKERVH